MLNKLANALTLCLLLGWTGGACVAQAEMVEVTLNDLRLVLDRNTGSVLRMGCKDVEQSFIQTPSGYAGIIDLAYPIPKFEPLRLASRFSKQVDIALSDGRATLTWDGLGASRPFSIDGKVWAQVEMQALPDGKSVSLRCRLRNDSDVAVRQVLFPDFLGLQPFAGEAGTELRSGGFVTRPFEALQPRLDGAWYAPMNSDTVEYAGGGGYTSMITRCIDYGGLAGGFSLFPKVWAGAPRTRIRLNRTETHKTLRLSSVRDVHIKKGQTWESEEWVLTPHCGGWAKGIGPYRAWVQEHIHRKWAMPERVKNGLGFRTIWMCKGYPADPEHDPDFRFTDLPRVARESHEHGLDEMVIWFWQQSFMPSIQDAPPYAHLGTPDQLSKAIDECRAMGVNMSLFVSWVSIANPAAQRYGVTVPPGGWNYHPEMIPRSNPPYAVERATGALNLANNLWQEDVIHSFEHIRDHYTPSICWDQVLGDPVSGEMYRLFDRIREKQSKVDPKAAFSGETCESIEKDADYLDYTWNWLPYQDFRAYQAAFDAPRFNLNIDRHLPHVFYGFLDNRYLNVMPSKPDGANGSAMIADYPELGAALKTVLRLRKQFRPYFLDGAPIGNGLLRQETHGTYTSCYLLSDRALLLVMNVGEPQVFTMHVDLAPWLEAANGSYTLRQYRMDGTQIAQDVQVDSRWSGATEKLPKWSIEVFEFVKH